MSLHVDFFQEPQMDHYPQCTWVCPNCQEENHKVFSSKRMEEITQGLTLTYPDKLRCKSCHIQYLTKDLFLTGLATESVISEPNFGLDQFR